MEKILLLTAANLRGDYRNFSAKLPFKNIGRLVYYSIYDVANFLLNGESTPSKEVQEEVPALIQIKKKPAKSKAPVQDWSHIFMLRAFAQSLEERATAMLSLAENLKDYANKKEMMEIGNRPSFLCLDCCFEGMPISSANCSGDMSNLPLVLPFK